MASKGQKFNKYSIELKNEILNKYLEDNKDVSMLIITHYTRILDYIKPEFVHMMKEHLLICLILHLIHQ